MAAVRAKVPVLLHDRYSAQIHKGLALMDKLLEKDVAKACLFSVSRLHRTHSSAYREKSKPKRLRRPVTGSP